MASAGSSTPVSTTNTNPTPKQKEILEDMAIGRYLKAKAPPPALLDLQDPVVVYMYDDFDSAWRGFRKNTYLLLGGTPARFVLFFGVYLLA